jgi:hypothetical protein
LRSRGISVEVHDDHLPQDADDEDWIELSAKNRWISVTKDRQIRYRRAEIDSIRKNRSRVIVIRAKHTSGHDIADTLALHTNPRWSYIRFVRLTSTREVEAFTRAVERAVAVLGAPLIH